MIHRHILFLLLFSTFIFWGETAVLGQIHLSDKKDWYRPDYAALKVDTVKIGTGAPVGQIRFSDLITMAYNKQGYLTFYEKATYSYRGIESTRFHVIINPEIRKDWVRNTFTYDDKMRLLKISFKTNSPSAIIDRVQDQRNLKKYGGLLPDYYDHEIQRRDQEVFMKVNSIHFTYDPKGKPAKQLIIFELVGKNTVLTSGGSPREYNPYYSSIYIKERKSSLDTLIFHNHGTEIYDALGLTHYSNRTYKYAKEEEYTNCHHRDLADKWLWTQPLDSFLCKGQTIINPGSKSTRNLNFQSGIFSRIFDSKGKLSLTKSISPYYEKEFNCAKVSYCGTFTEFHYNTVDQQEKKTTYTIFRLATDSNLPKPFCSSQEEVLFHLPKNYIAVKAGSTNYYYNASGLLEREESDYYDFRKSLNLEGYGYRSYDQNQRCNVLCFELEKGYNQEKFFSYTFHP